MTETMRAIEMAFVEGGEKATKLYVSPIVYAEIRGNEEILTDPLRPERTRTGLPVVDVIVEPSMDGWRLD